MKVSLTSFITTFFFQDLYKSKFFEHKMSCKSLIELKQRSLPRLTFLSDQEALILLGGLTGERDIFQRVSRKIFGHGVGQLCFETQVRSYRFTKQTEFFVNIRILFPGIRR